MISFSEFQKIIDDFLLTLPKSSGEIGALPLSDAIFCAEDRARNRIIFSALQEASATKEKGFIAVDAGCGLGIFGIVLLLLGAKKVYFIENNPETIQYAKRLAENFNIEKNRMIFLEEDATEVSLSENFDLLFSETITTGFVSEDFPRIVRHLQQYAKKDALFLPERFVVTLSQRKKKDTQTIFSAHFPEKISISLPLTREEKITFSMVTIFFGDNMIASGDCQSLGNDRFLEDPFRHPLFQFQKISS